MPEYKDLKEHEKRLFDDIENIFLNTNINSKRFSKILVMLANKYN